MSTIEKLERSLSDALMVENRVCEAEECSTKYVAPVFHGQDGPIPFVLCEECLKFKTEEKGLLTEDENEKIERMYRLALYKMN